MAFGKADIGLIKAVAGAEQSKFVDDNLMIGSVVGGMMDSLNKKAQVRAGIQAGIQKDIDGKFKGTSANLPDQFTKNLVDFVPGQKNKYANVSAGGVLGKSEQSRIIANHDDYLLQVESLVGNIKANQAFGGDLAPGHNDNTKHAMLQLDGGNYEVFTSYDSDGKPKPSISMPNEDGIEPDESTFTYKDGNESGNVKTLKATIAENPDFVVTPKMQEQLDAYDTAQDNFSKWQGGEHTLADGTPNPKKYDILNNIPSKQSNQDNAAAELAVYNNNVSLLRNDTDHEMILEPSAYGTQYTKQIKGYNGIDLQNTYFTDASNDKIEGNSYGEFFTSQSADPKKHPNMYKTSDGEFIKFTMTDGTVIAYDDGTSEKGLDTPWGRLNDSQQEKLLKMHISGENVDGTFDPDKESDFHKVGYASFMGGVTRDAAEIKQQQYFSNKNMYFNNGDGNPISRGAKGSDITENRKLKAYSDHKFDAAFPESMLGGDNFNEKIEPGGAIQKALAKEFPGRIGFIGSGIIAIDGVASFDFRGDNKKQEMQRLKEYLHNNPEFSDIEKSLGSNMSVNVKGDDWKKMRRKKSEYHGYAPVNDYLAFRGIGGTQVEGTLTVKGFNPSNNAADGTSGVYEVVDSNGKTHFVDEETLYPNGI